MAAVLASSGCGAASSPAAAFPQGAFRAERPAEAFVEAGVSEQDTYYHAGIWTLTFDDGRVEVDDVNEATSKRSTETGVYCLDGDQISLGLSTCGDFWTATWVSEDGEIRFEDLEAGFAHDGPGEQLLLTTIFGSDGWSTVR